MFPGISDLVCQIPLLVQHGLLLSCSVCDLNPVDLVVRAFEASYAISTFQHSLVRVALPLRVRKILQAWFHKPPSPLGALRGGSHLRGEIVTPSD